MTVTKPNGVVDTVPPASSIRTSVPDPEVPERARRRRFTAADKLRILEEADTCVAPGQIGALLRREGLYSSHLVDWRRQRAQGTFAALTPRRRGRPATAAPAAEIMRLRADNERLTRQLAAAEAIIEIQKKVSLLLGLTQRSDETSGPR